MKKTCQFSCHPLKENRCSISGLASVSIFLFIRENAFKGKKTLIWKNDIPTFRIAYFFTSLPGKKSQILGNESLILLLSGEETLNVSVWTDIPAKNRNIDSNQKSWTDKFPLSVNVYVFLEKSKCEQRENPNRQISLSVQICVFEDNENASTDGNSEQTETFIVSSSDKQTVQCIHSVFGTIWDNFFFV